LVRVACPFEAALSSFARKDVGTRTIFALAAGRNMAYYAMELGSDEDFGSEDGDFEPAAESDEEMEEMEEENYPEPLLPRQRRQRERARRERARIPSASSCLGRAGPGMS